MRCCCGVGVGKCREGLSAVGPTSSACVRHCMCEVLLWGRGECREGVIAVGPTSSACVRHCMCKVLLWGRSKYVQGRGECSKAHIISMCEALHV